MKIRKVSPLPGQSLASASCPAKRVWACPWGPPGKIAHKLAKPLIWLQVCHLSGQSPRTWRLKSTCREGKRTQAGWLSVSSLPVPKASVADGQKPSLTTGGFLAGPPNHALILSNPRHHLALFCAVTVPFPDTDTAGTHTKERLKSLPAKYAGEKVVPQGEQRQHALSIPICTKHRA